MREQLNKKEMHFDTMNGTVKELRHIHGVQLAKPTEGVIEQLHVRWRQLLGDCCTREENLINLSAATTDGVDSLQGNQPSQIYFVIKSTFLLRNCFIIFNVTECYDGQLRLLDI